MDLFGAVVLLSSASPNNFSLYFKKVLFHLSLTERICRGQHCSFVLTNTLDHSHERSVQQLTASPTVYLFFFRYV